MSFLLLLLLPFGAFASTGGNEVGNGGDVVVCSDSVRLLDYFENESLKRGPLEFPKSDDPYVLAEKEIRRLSKLNPQLERQYLQVLGTLKKRVQMIEDADFRDVKDSFEVSIPTGCSLQQIAIQQNDSGQRSIRISKKLWDRLGVEHRAGLILHEIIYEHFVFLGETNSVKARKFNSYLASKKILSATVSEFQNFARGLKLPLY
jgi:hypothetical protein